MWKCIVSFGVFALLLPFGFKSGSFVFSSECNSDTGQCCQNYYKVNGNCTECPAGTFGLNCSGVCPEDYYGVFCEERCNCSGSQYCDLINGCVQNRSYTRKREKVPPDTNAVHISFTKEPTTVTIFKDTYVWENMTYALSGSIVTALVVAAITCLRSRLKKNRKHQSFRCPAENQADPSADGQSNGELNIENIDYVQENARGEASGNMNNIYDDLRTSKILDTFPVDVTEEISFSTCSTENDIPNRVHSVLSNRLFIESQLIYTNSDEDVKTGDISIPNYEQFPMPFQYSILSLKRNINPPAAELYMQTEYSCGDAYDFVKVYENSGNSCSSDSQSESDADSTLLKTKNEKAER